MLYRILCITALLCASAHAQELPRTLLDTTPVPVTGISISAPAGGNLQLIINSARPGDEIVLPTGAAYTGNFALPAKSGTSPVLIRWSEVPPVGVRVSPDYSGRMPKLVTPNADPVLKAAPGAHHYRFIGIEFTQAAVTQTYDLIQLGTGQQSTLAEVPSDLIFDRCYMHGNSAATLRRGVALNSARTSIIDSYISDCHEQGADSQAVCGWNGPGPFKIVNNYLEGAGENVMFGGADPRIPGLVPSDIEFRKNHCFKPLSWKIGHASYAGKPWSIKNIFELKNARRVLVDGNVFENNWPHAQDGFAILFTVRNQEGTAPWSVVEEITFTNNILRHASAAINILGRDNNNPSQQLKRLKIANNLFEDISGRNWGGNGVFLRITETVDVAVDHNTILHTGNVITAYGVSNQGFTYTNNLSLHNDYGVIGDARGIGLPTLNTYFPGYVFKFNLLAGGLARLYPPENFFGPLDLLPDFRLPPGSPLAGAGSDGRDIGADIDAVMGVIVPPEESDLERLERLNREIEQRNREMGEIIRRLRGGV